jgi:hypothetical protein
MPSAPALAHTGNTVSHVSHDGAQPQNPNQTTQHQAFLLVPLKAVQRVTAPTPQPGIMAAAAFQQEALI